MNLSFKLYQTKKQSRVIVRCQKKDLDISCALEIFVEPDMWDSELQLLTNSPIVNEKLLELKKTILSEYNNSYVTGQIIGKRWLQSIISDVFQRPSGEKKLVNSEANIYLSAFANEWLKTDGKAWKTGHNRVISKTMLGQYQNAVDLLIGFEKSTNRKILMKDIDVDDFYEFVNYLQEELDYNVSTIDRIIGRLKFFCNRACEKGIKISSAYNKRIYLEKEEDIDGVYLNDEEISKIYNLQIDDENLDNARDNLVLSCYLGLRVSDFMRNLSIDNIKDGIVSIKTKKTGAFVKIPLHPYCKQILNKRFGQLPKRFTEHQYNTLIKTVGQIAEIDDSVFGSLWDNEKKRKVKGYRPKYKYLSSHVGRRSFATNLSGKVSPEIIMSCAGWSTKAMTDFYNKTSKKEYAEKLKEYWLR